MISVSAAANRCRDRDHRVNGARPGLLADRFGVLFQTSRFGVLFQTSRFGLRFRTSTAEARDRPSASVITAALATQT
jgi:hypothetical protein